MSVLGEIAAIMAAIGAGCSAYVAWLGFQAVRANHAPRVIVRVVHDELRQSLLVLVIENVGQSIARAISFTPSRPIPGRAWGIEPTAVSTKIEPLTTGPLVTGIPALGPGEKRRVLWGQYGGLHAALGPNPLQVIADFKDDKGRSHATISFLDVVSFETTDMSTDDPLVAIANELKSIHQGLKGGKLT